MDPAVRDSSVLVFAILFSTALTGLNAWVSSFSDHWYAADYAVCSWTTCGDGILYMGAVALALQRQGPASILRHNFRLPCLSQSLICGKSLQVKWSTRFEDTAWSSPSNAYDYITLHPCQHWICLRDYASQDTQSCRLSPQRGWSGERRVQHKTRRLWGLWICILNPLSLWDWQANHPEDLRWRPLHRTAPRGLLHAPPSLIRTRSLAIQVHIEVVEDENV